MRILRSRRRVLKPVPNSRPREEFCSLIHRLGLPDAPQCGTNEGLFWSNATFPLLFFFHRLKIGLPGSSRSKSRHCVSRSATISSPALLNSRATSPRATASAICFHLRFFDDKLFFFRLSVSR